MFDEKELKKYNFYKELIDSNYLKIDATNGIIENTSSGKYTIILRILKKVILMLL